MLGCARKKPEPTEPEKEKSTDEMIEGLQKQRKEIKRRTDKVVSDDQKNKSAFDDYQKEIGRKK